MGARLVFATAISYAHRRRAECIAPLIIGVRRSLPMNIRFKKTRHAVESAGHRSFHGERAAFTLIELLIVVAIIGILAAIAVPNFLNAQVRAKISRAQADMRSLGTALESYMVDFNAYPPDGDDDGSFDFDSRRRLRSLTTPISYMSSLPTDPFHVQELEFPGSELLYPGIPPHTFAYNTAGSFDGSNGPANRGRPDNYGLTSLGPSKMFDSITSVDGLPVLYASSNGLVSTGDILYRGGNSQTRGR